MLGLIRMLEGLWLMSSQEIKIGVLGCANIAERFVIPAINNLEIFNLVAIASRTKSKAEQFSKLFNTQAVNSYEELVKRDDIQAVYIPLPNSLHFEWIKKSLLSGKHVLVEKSMACSADEVNELNDLAREKSLVLLENFQFRKHIQLDKIKEIISSGDLGELRCIRSSFGFPPFADKENIRYKKELGGGALLDAGAYPLKVAQELTEYSLSVDSASLFYDKEFNVDTWGSAQLKCNSSALTVQVAFGFDHAYQCNLEIWGSKGILRSNRIFTSPPGVAAELELTNGSGAKKITLEVDNHFENMLTYFAELMLSPEKATNEYQNNVKQAQLIEQLRREAYE